MIICGSQEQQHYTKLGITPAKAKLQASGSSPGGAGDVVSPVTSEETDCSSITSLSHHRRRSSNHSSCGTLDLIGLRSGQISPTSTCRQRNLSSVIVTDEVSDHELAKGRQKIVVNRMHLSMPKLGRSQTVPMDSSLTDVTNTPQPLHLDAWSEAPACTFNVRSEKYFSGGGSSKKKKAPSADALFKLLTVDLVQVQKPNYKGMCAHPEERIQLALKKEQEIGIPELPEFVFAVNLCVPTSKNVYHHCVFYFGCDDIDAIQTSDTPVGRVAKPFFFGDSDEYRDKTFKLIPRIVEGNFLVRKAVGSTPAILGSKIKQNYIRTDRYFEVIVDISSDKIAQSIVGLSLSYAKSLVVDMMFLLEGHEQCMLPERILGGVRMKNIDFKNKDGQRVCSPMS